MRGVLGLLLLLLTAGASAGVVGIIKMPLGKTFEKKLVAPLTWLRELILCARRSFVLTKLLLLFQHCNSIEALNLQHCKKITDRTCQSLSLHCHKLQKLDLSSCPAVTDVSLHALSQGCPNLVHLDISWCDLVSGNGIRALGNGCRKLKVFIAKGCHHIRDDALGYLARHCQKLTKVNVQVN